MTATDSFQIPWHTHALSGMIHRFPWFWKRIGNFETTVLSEELKSIQIDRPIYIAGLARSGSTILLEAIAAQPSVTTHQYRDFPAIYTPYWWNSGQNNTPCDETPQERAHKDGLLVTSQSPEAMEEMLWMSFFSQAHQPQQSQVLTENTSHPKFEKFYVDHIRKLLLVRKGNRFASKENYNVTRMKYLRKLFPDVKFVIPIRSPLNHIASLMKQHKLFCEGEKKYPRALEHMRRVGHFEFGLDLRLINTGNDAVLSEIEDLWKRGEDVRGWARYWASLHQFLYHQLSSDSDLRNATIIVSYEKLCESPHQTLADLMSHCQLDDVECLNHFAQSIQAPKYYQPNFNDSERNAISEETAEVVEQIGTLHQ